MTTAATVKPGECLEFYAIPVAHTDRLASGSIRVEYARPYDDTGNTWRIYPPSYPTRF